VVVIASIDEAAGNTSILLVGMASILRERERERCERETDRNTR
jgi:hypothetical protein